jgi:hypothetical protein
MASSISHIAWVAVAAGAFFAGGKFMPQAGSDTANQTGRKVQDAAGSRPVSSSTLAKGTMLLPELSILKDVEGFVSRYAAINGELTSEQMQAAMDEVLQESDPVKSSLMFSLLLEKLSPANAPDVLKQVQAKVPGFDGFRYIGLLSYKWGGLDGPNAMAAAMKQSGPGRFVGMAGLAGWAGKDPQAAMNWMKDQKIEGWEKGMMTRGLITGIAKGDSQMAVDYVAGMADKDERTRMTQAIAEEKLKQGVDTAATWALGLKDPEMKRGAFESVADQFYRADPNKAMTYVKDNANQPYAVNAAGELGRRLAEQEPKKALSYAETLSAGDARTKAYSGTFREWAGKDPEAASTMLQSMPAGADRDGAAAGLAPAVTKDEPEAGRAWAEAISSPDLRQKTLTDVLRIEYRTNPDGVTSYMQSNNWNQEQVDAVRITKDDRPRFGPPR